MDAERYRGYDEAIQTADDQGGRSAVGDDVRISSDSGVSASIGDASPILSMAGQSGGDTKTPASRMGGDSSPCSILSTPGSELPSASGIAEPATSEDGGSDRTKGGERGAFLDVVPFNNVRAKYLRPWNDRALSRPYHIPPSSDKGKGGGSRSRSVSITAGSSSPATVGSRRTMEAHRATREETPRWRGKTLTGKHAKAWGWE